MRIDFDNVRIMIVCRWLSLAAAVLITLAGGVLYGSYSQRWNPPAELAVAAADLEMFPLEIGRWKASDELPIEEEARKMLECAGSVNRRYINQDSGDSIRMVVLVGPPGPIAVHTPEICYSSRDYEINGDRTETILEASPGRQHSFWRVDFAPRNALADGLRVYYAWTSDRIWKASGSPRFEYAGEPLLYKIQLATPVTDHLNDNGLDPGRQFLEEFVKSDWTQGANREL
jgi:hypothetical protein